MANYNSLKATVNANIKANNNQEITGPVLNTVLTQMIDTIGAGYQYAGIATPSVDPGTPDNKVFYIAAEAGTYQNFGNIVVNDGEVAILKWDIAWTKDLTGCAAYKQVMELINRLSRLTEISVLDIIENAGIKGDLSGITYGVAGKSVSRFAIQSGRKYLVSLSGANSVVFSNADGSLFGGGATFRDYFSFTNSGWAYLYVDQIDPARAQAYLVEDEDVISFLESEVESIQEDVAENTAQIESLSQKIGDIDIQEITFVQEKAIYGLRYPPVDVSNPMTDDPGFRCAFVPIQPGQLATINATGEGIRRTWGFVDASGNVLSDSGYEVYEFTGFKVAAPPNSAYLVINDTNTGGRCYIGQSVDDRLDEIKDSLYVNGEVITSWDDIDEKFHKYIASDGTESSSDYRWTSDFIMVRKGATISCSGMNLNIGGGTCFGIACYDENKAFIPGKGLSGSTSAFSGNFVVDEDVAYIKISDVANSYAEFSIKTIESLAGGVEKALMESQEANEKIGIFNKNGVSLLGGKTIAMFGDSIYEIAGSGSGARKRISDYLAEYSEATILNFGFGGSSICNTHISSPDYAKFDLVNLLPAVVAGDLSEQEAAAAVISPEWTAIVQRLENFSFADCDIVILGYGSNDYTNGSTIEDMRAQLAVSLQMIFQANPEIHVVLDLPHYRVWDTPDNFVDDAYTHLNTYGKTLGEYCDAIEDAGKQFGVVSNPNLFNSGWNRYNMNEYFFHADGAHFLSNACEICAGRLFDTLNRQGWK